MRKFLCWIGWHKWGGIRAEAVNGPIKLVRQCEECPQQAVGSYDPEDGYVSWESLDD